MNKINNNHIALFIPSLRGGGAERMMINLANEFVKRGLKVDLVLVQKEGPYLKIVNKEVNIVDLKVKRVLFSLFPLVKYLKKEKPNTLIASIDHANIIAIISKFLARSNVKIIARIANTFSFSLKGTKWYKRGLRKYGAMIFYRFAEKIITNSQGSNDDLVKFLKISRERIKVIHNPTITSNLFEKSKEKLDHPWLKNKKYPVILGVGRLHKAKDFFTLIKAFNEFKKLRESKLIILGEGDDRKKLQELINVLGLENNINMLGFVDNPYAYMAQADVYVLSSRWEGLPNALIEAMACGTPIVSTDCPSGPAEILENGKYGKLIPVGDHEAMAEAILETLENSTNPKLLQKRARDFSVEKITDKYLELIN